MTELSADAPAPAPAAPTHDRTISPIAGQIGSGMTGKVMTMAALAVGGGLFMFSTLHKGLPKAHNGPVEPARQTVGFEPVEAAAPAVKAAGRATAPTLMAPGTLAPVLDSPFDGATSSQVPALQPAGAGSADSASAAQSLARAQGPTRVANLQAIRSAPILVFSQSSSRLGPGVGEGVPSLAPAAATGSPTELDQLRHGSPIGLAKADRLPNRDFLITAGTSIPCTLETAMDTSTPGYVTCLIGQDVYSDNGAVILLEKGAKVLGEYRSGMKLGQKRLFVLWTRAVTPAGVVIGLASPASDALGRAGFDGVIDSHFWERFGGALLLSIIDDASAAVATRNDPNGQTTRAPSDAAGIALQNSIGIPPNLTKAQGSQVAIFAAQDFDFSTVYGLKAR